MRNRLAFPASLRLATFLFFSILVCGADGAIMPFSGSTGGISYTASTTMRGYAFEVFSPVYVGALGTWDRNSDGWAGSPTALVQLWDQNAPGAPLAEVEIDPLGSPLDPSIFTTTTGDSGQVRYEELASPLLLPVGLYSVAVFSGDIDDTPNLIRGHIPTGVDPAIGSFSWAVGLADGEFAAAGGTAGEIILGGTILLEPGAVPEPGALIMLATIVTLGLVVRRRNSN